MTQQRDDVLKFMRASHLTTGVWNPKQAEFQLALILEEVGELCDAFKLNALGKHLADVARSLRQDGMPEHLRITAIDFIPFVPDQLDALFDVWWLCLKCVESLGANSDEMWREGAASNLAKINSVSGLVEKDETGKVMKPSGWAPPDFESIAKKIMRPAENV